MPPRRVLPRHPQHQQAYGCRCRQPARTSTFRVIPLAPPACDASSTTLPASRRTPAPTGGGATGGSAPPARSDPAAYTEDAELAGAEPGLRPQHQQLNVFRALAAEAQPQHRDHPADKPVHDAESHPHIIPTAERRSPKRPAQVLIRILKTHRLGGQPPSGCAAAHVASYTASHCKPE